MGLVSAFVFFPLLGLMLLLLPEKFVKKGLVLIFLLWLIFLVFVFWQSSLEKILWFSLPLARENKLNVFFEVGFDQWARPMVLLTVLVGLIGAIASHSIVFRIKEYVFLYCLMFVAIAGTFLAQDLVLFFVYFEFMLLPMFFLIGIWGGQNKEYASMKFFIYTLIGSVFILLAIILLAYQSSQKDISLSYGEVVSALPPSKQVIWQGMNASELIFLMFFIGFAIKIPAVPLHTWLPDAHVEAPTPVSVVLAGILLKIGGFGLLKYGIGLFPDFFPVFGGWMAFMGVLAIVYAAYTALGSQNLKTMIAYSSVSHMGFVVLGLASGTELGYQGAVFQMFSHGIISASLFLGAGFLYERTHDLKISSYSGLLSKMPFFGFCMGGAFFAALGLPGFSGFIGELTVLIAAFRSQLPVAYPIFATLGLVLGAAYFIYCYKRMFFGTFYSLSEIDVSKSVYLELGLMSAVLLISLILGLAPFLVFDLMK